MGKVFSRQELELIADLCTPRNIIILADEVSFNRSTSQPSLSDCIRLRQAVLCTIHTYIYALCSHKAAHTYRGLRWEGFLRNGLENWISYRSARTDTIRGTSTYANLFRLSQSPSRSCCSGLRTGGKARVLGAVHRFDVGEIEEVQCDMGRAWSSGKSRFADLTRAVRSDTSPPVFYPARRLFCPGQFCKCQTSRGLLLSTAYRF